MDAFEQWVRGGLEQAGLEVTDLDVQIARVIQSIYGPELQSLAAVDMNGLWPEADLDPSRAPSS